MKYQITLLFAGLLLTLSPSGYCAPPEKRVVIFEDDFEGRTEIGDDYVAVKSGDEAFAIKDGIMIARQIKPDHGAVLRKELAFGDIDIEVDFRFSGGTRFNFVIDDKKEKSVHAGHICRVSISPKQLVVGDDKLGSMNLEVRKKRKATDLTPEESTELEAFLATKQSSAKINLKKGDWYRLRVLIIGDLMEAFLDGKLITKLRSGGFAHPTKSKFGVTVNGETIDFDNLKVYEVGSADASPTPPPETAFVDLLENGDLSNFFTGSKGKKKWVLKDGVVSRGEEKTGGFMTRKKYKNFELKFDWKIAEGGNSGIIYRANKGQGLEYQVLDDERHIRGKTPNSSAAALYDLVGPVADKPYHVAGEWNSGRIVCDGKHIEHWLNGSKVLEIEIGSDDWNDRFAKSKFVGAENFANWENNIQFQDHGADVSYRNILVREL